MRGWLAGLGRWEEPRASGGHVRSFAHEHGIVLLQFQCVVGVLGSVSICVFDLVGWIAALVGASSLPGYLVPAL